MKQKILALSLVLGILFSATVFSVNWAMANPDSSPYVSAASLAVNDWPMFHYNAAHTGSPDDTAPSTHDLLWSSNTTASTTTPQC